MARASRYGRMLPLHLVLHGVCLTAWYVLILVQSSLIAARRRRAHRRLGMLGAGLAVGVVVTSLFTVLYRDAYLIHLDSMPTRAFPNLVTLFAFAICAGAGILLRHRSSAHKRLMLLASISALPPALDRLGLAPPLERLFGRTLGWFPGPPEMAPAIAGLLTLLLAVLVHDLVREGRVRTATISGVLSMLVAAPALSALVTFSGAWAAFVRALP